MIPTELLPVLIFVSVTAALMALVFLRAPTRDRVAARVRQLAGAEPPTAAPGVVGRAVRRAVARIADPLTPSTEREKRFDQLRLRLTHAGYYGRSSLFFLLAVKLLLVLVPCAAVAGLVLIEQVRLKTGATALAFLAGAGLVAPGLWLDSAKKTRQNDLRRGLPDFFDVLVLCVEGGMSLLAAWRGVTNELEHAFPHLWKELVMVQQEADIGRPVGDALTRFAQRTDLDEVTSLASVVGQSERMGTELARPLRTLSDTLRLQRVQRAEEAAHKTATKIMFPTLLFIFPGVFAILLGPMIIQVLNIFSAGKK